MELSLTKLLLLAFVVLIVFGTGKLPKAMKDLGAGIRKFKQGLNDDADDEIVTRDQKILPKEVSTTETIRDTQNDKVQ